MMRVSVAYTDHIAVSSLSLAWGGLSCLAELQRAQGTKDGACPHTLLHAALFFLKIYIYRFEGACGGSKGSASKASTDAEQRHTLLK